MENTFFRRAIIVFLLSFTILVITSAFYLFLNTKDILLVSDLTADFRDKVYLKDNDVTYYYKDKMLCTDLDCSSVLIKSKKKTC